MRVPLLLVLLLVPGTAVSYAQAPRPDRPLRGLFGAFGDTADALVVSGSLGGGWSDDVVRGSEQRPGGVGDPRRARAGSFGFGSTALSYSRPRDRVGLSASASSSTRYYPGQVREFVTTYGANVGASLQVLPRTGVRVGQSIAYQPENLWDLFAGLDAPGSGVPPVADEDVAIGSIYYRALTTTAGASHQIDLGRQSSLDFSYGYAHRRLTVRDRRYDTHNAGGGYRRQLTRGLAVRLGYRYTGTRSRSGVSAQTVGTHGLDGGLTYSRALAFSRRTSLSFSTGSSAVSQRGVTRFRLNGNARLNHEIGRTWAAWAAYGRGFGFVDAFDQPAHYDSVTGGVGGLLSRRVQFSGTARTSFGALGLTDSQRYGTLIGTASASVAINRFMAAGASYTYHRYSFDETVLLPPGVSPRTQRHSVRAQLTMTAPLFQSARRRNAAR